MKCGILKWIVLFYIFSFISAIPYEPFRFNFTRSRYSLRRVSTTTPASTETIKLDATANVFGNAEGATSLPTNMFNDALSGVKSADKTVASTEAVYSMPEIQLDTSTSSIAKPASLASTISTTETIDAVESLIHNCGVRSNEDFPWIAVLEHTDPYANSKRSRKTLSKGVLISPQHVLTTVSSIYNSNPFWTVSKVRLGDIPTWGDVYIHHDKSAIVSVDVQQIFQHERKDIAVVKLVQAVGLTASIMPICLPDHDHYNFRELQLHVCRRQTSRSESSVTSVPVTPLLPQDCSIMFERKRAQYTLGEFCAWDEAGDTCTGDLGGPLIAESNGRATVIGLNSYISAKEEFDAGDYPGIYTRVGAHLKWINAVLKL